MNQIIKNHFNETLDYTFAPGVSNQKKSDWLVILGHGVTGNKDRPVMADTAKALNAAGFDTLGFSFAGNGESEGRFENATISKEVNDLNAILDAAAPAYSNICYIGHSMGGAVGVIQAARDRRIKALVSLAGMIDTKAFAETEFGEEVPNEGVMWEEASCPLSSAFMQDLCQTIATVAPQAESIDVPWLLLHGTADDVVLPRDSEHIQSLEKKTTEIAFITDADHSFNEPAHKQQMTTKVVAWLKAQSSSKTY
jgi:alpha-beta hydrolase superfamily lysophospholipase